MTSREACHLACKLYGTLGHKQQSLIPLHVYVECKVRETCLAHGDHNNDTMYDVVTSDICIVYRTAHKAQVLCLYFLHAFLIYGAYNLFMTSYV